MLVTGPNSVAQSDTNLEAERRAIRRAIVVGGFGGIFTGALIFVPLAWLIG